MWLFQHPRALACLLLLNGCQLAENQSLGPLPSDAAVELARDPGASERRVEAARGCGKGALCFAEPRSATGACDASLEWLLSAGKLTAPASCEVVKEAAAAAGTPTQRRAAVLRIQQADFEQPYWVALGSEHGYEQVVELMVVRSGINTALTLSVRHLTFEDLLPGGEPELRIELQSIVDDHDCSGEWSWRTHRSDLGICSFDQTSGVYCLAPLPRSLRRIETQYHPQADRDSSELVEQYALDVSFDRGELVVRKTSGRVPEEVAPFLGRHLLRDVRQLTEATPFPI